MPKLAEAWVELDGRDSGLNRALRTAEANVSRSVGNMQARIGRLGHTLRGIGMGLSLGVTTPIIGVGIASLKMAADAEESENLFEVSMGRMAGAARAWSEQLSQALGLNAFEVRRNVGMFNVMFQSFGLGEAQAYDMAKGLTQLAYDMASFYNLPFQEALEKLQSGISGEIEPLRRLGIVVDDTTAKAWALSHGVTTNWETADRATKTWVRYNLIMEATKKAQGDMARTIESPANRIRQFLSLIDMLSIAFGQILLPALLAVVNWGKRISEWLDKLGPTGKRVILIAAGIAAALGPVLVILGQMALAISALIPVIAAVAANPVVLAAIAGFVVYLAQLAVGLTIGITLLRKLFEVVKSRWTDIKPALDRFLETVSRLGRVVVATLLPAWEKFSSMFGTFLTRAANIGINIFIAVLNRLADVLEHITSAVLALNRAMAMLRAEQIIRDKGLLGLLAETAKIQIMNDMAGKGKAAGIPGTGGAPATPPTAAGGAVTEAAPRWISARDLWTSAMETAAKSDTKKLAELAEKQLAVQQGQLDLMKEGALGGAYG